MQSYNLSHVKQIVKCLQHGKGMKTWKKIPLIHISTMVKLNLIKNYLNKLCIKITITDVINQTISELWLKENVKQDNGESTRKKDLIECIFSL